VRMMGLGGLCRGVVGLLWPCGDESGGALLACAVGHAPWGMCRGHVSWGMCRGHVSWGMCRGACAVGHVPWGMCRGACAVGARARGDGYKKPLPAPRDEKVPVPVPPMAACCWRPAQAWWRLAWWRFTAESRGRVGWETAEAEKAASV